MKNKDLLLAAAAFLGLLLAVIIGIFAWHSLEAGSLAGSTDSGLAADTDAGFLAEGQGREQAEAFAEDGGQTETLAQGAAAGQTEILEAGQAQGEEAGGSRPGDGKGAQPGDGKGAQPEEGQGARPEEELPVRLVFAGDIYLSDHVLAAYEAAGGIRGVVDSELAEVIGAGDIFMANQEFPFSHRGTPAPDKQYTFRLAPERVSLLQEMGVDIVTLANNHALDYGTEALLDTCEILDEAGIRRVGAGKNLDEARAPVILEAQGKKIGFLGASRVIPVTSWNASSQSPGMLTTYDPAILLEEIKKLRPLCDYLVVYVHWGIERDERPQEYQRALGQQYIDAGADLVIGSHPHVLQGIEYYKGKPIVYSLGNFVFGSSIPRTALLTAVWDGEETRLSLTPAVSGGGFTRAVTDAGEQAAFCQYMTEISYGVEVSGEGVRPVSGEAGQ